MSRRKKSRDTESSWMIPPYEPVPEVNPEEMTFAVQVFRAGHALRIPVAKPENKGEIVPENRLVPKDTRFHQGLGALMTHYAGHPQRLAIFNRVWAFYFLITGVGRERLKQWQKLGMLHSAVLEAVAVAPV